MPFIRRQQRLTFLRQMATVLFKLFQTFRSTLMTLSSASSGARRIRFVFFRDTEDALNIIIIHMQLNIEAFCICLL